MPDFAPAGECPVCRTPGVQQASHATRDAYHLNCGNCGKHIISGTAMAQLKADMASPEQVALRAHGFFKIGAETIVGSEQLDRLGKTGDLPGASECIDNLLIHLATLGRPGQEVQMQARSLQAAVGAVSGDSTIWVLQEAAAAGLIQTEPFTQAESYLRPRKFLLTAAGWAHRASLMRAGAGSRHAFMAMDFNQADIRDYFSQQLQGAVAQTGFELRTTDHPGKTADLIDNRMRVDLRTSRFVVCDLTHGNRGAYWEAGFAEGIGRPVFYICRRDVLDSTDKATRPHFDAAHQAIVAWDPADPAPGLAELKAMIRATLPAEARMEDPAGDVGARPGQP